MAAHVWNGSTWLPAKTIPVWNGTVWLAGNRYVWNGSTWVGFQDDITINNEDVTGTAENFGEVVKAEWSIDNSSGFVTSTGVVTAPIEQFPSYFESYQWNLNPDNSGQYQIFVSASNGIDSGVLNTWLDLTSTRTWFIESSSDRSTTLTITIRNKLTQQIFDTATVSLSILTFN